MRDSKSGMVAILGAAGAVAGLFARRLRDVGWTILGFDLRTPSHHPEVFDAFFVGDAGAPNPSATDALGRCECLMICLPEDQAIQVIEQLSIPRSIALVVDTLSVKTPIFERASLLGPSREHLSINPMFAPSVGFEGQPIAVVGRADGPRASSFVRMLGEWGARVAPMSVDDHDRMCAAMQAGTHAMLLSLGTVCGQGFRIADLVDVAPPPHLICLALVARIVSAAPEVYWDIQRHNPHAADIRRRIIRSLTELDSSISRNDHATFLRILSDIRGSFGDQLERLSGTAASAIRGASDTIRPKDPK